MPESKFFTRDISWLQFNHRVLQEAADPSVPLYERLKFLAIYSSNLDEFFRVRVSSLRTIRKMKDIAERFHVKPKRLLREVKDIVRQQQEEFGKIFTLQILPELRDNGIFLINEAEYNQEQSAFARMYFDQKVAPVLEPAIVVEENIDIFLENKGLYLIVRLFDHFEAFGIIGIPDDMDRFVVLPTHEDRHYITFLDDIIRLNVHKAFPGHEIKGVYAVKMSRDAELYLGDEFSGDLLARIEARVKERSKGMPTRFLYDKSMPEDLLTRVRKHFHVSKYELIPGARYHNFNDFMHFPDPTDNPVLHDTPMPPQEHPVLERSGSMIRAIVEQDHLLHFPYQSYSYVPRLIDEAAEQPDVEWIKITLYRVANNSQVLRALLHALAKGKKVSAFIEAKARFDEESNLFWGRQLEQAGARVRYSFPGIKVHSKLLLVSFKPDVNPPHIAYLGTGNFNEKTAGIYADHALLTANANLTTEVSKIFDMLESKVIAPQCKHLFVSPFTTRPRFMELIDKEMANARAGKDAWMILKMNSLEDRRMISKLYEAGKAGVRIQCIVRGICCLKPGVKGLSENIGVISIVDRFLEHARVYIFANGGAERMYLASADWMTRNLDRRVEVVFPVYDLGLRDEIYRIINLQLNDNTKARIIDEEQSNRYVERQLAEPVIRAQTDTYSMLVAKHEV